MPIPRCLSRLVLLLVVLAAPALAAPQSPAWQPLGPYGGVVASLTADPSQPGVLYAAAGVSGVFKSTDRGASWRNILVGDARGNVAVDPVRPSVIYAISYPGGLWKSGDGGAHWTLIGRGRGLPPESSHRIYAVTVDPARRTRVYLTTSAGVWRSLNGGASWQSANEGIPEIPHVLLAVRRPAGTAFAGTTHGLYRTTDGGDSWKLLSQGLPTTASVAALAASEADPQTVYVQFLGSGFYRTTNGGSSWRQVTEPPVTRPSGLQALTSLVADPRSPAILYAALSNGEILRTADGARSWAVIGKMPGTYPMDLTPDPFAARVLYAGLVDSTVGIFRSDDGGATWQRRNQGYTAQEILAVSVAPGDPEQVWTATLAGHVFRSGNKGRQWARVASPGSPLMASRPRSPRSPTRPPSP